MRGRPQRRGDSADLRVIEVAPLVRCRYPYHAAPRSDWDLLRDDPRFQALLKEYPAEVRLR